GPDGGTRGALAHRSRAGLGRGLHLHEDPDFTAGSRVLRGAAADARLLNPRRRVEPPAEPRVDDRHGGADGHRRADECAGLPGVNWQAPEIVEGTSAICCYCARDCTGPRYLSSQSRISLIMGWMVTTAWPVSKMPWRLSAGGVPSRSNIGRWAVSTGSTKSYRPFSIRMGVVTRVAKLIWSTSGSCGTPENAPPSNTAALTRRSFAST